MGPRGALRSRWGGGISAAIVLSLTLGAIGAGASGCAAVFPEGATRFSKLPDLGTFDPPPPPDRHFMKVLSGRIPEKTRDGREWKEAFGGLPDTYVKVMVNGAEIFRTKPAADTLAPSWEGSPAGNFTVQVGDMVGVQIWDASAFADTPIGVKELRLTPDMVQNEALEFELPGGSYVSVKVAPAQAIWGAGFWYEYRNHSAYVSRLIDGSPASRSAMRRGDRILAIDGQTVDGMSFDEVRSRLGSISTAGVTLSLAQGEKTLQVTIKEGPIYPFYRDLESLPVKP